MRRLILRFGGFATLPLLSAVAPLLLLPIIARVGGVDGWASIATAQAIGTFGAVAVSFGWAIAGPPLIAQETSEEQRRASYRRSFSSRMIVFVVALPLLAVLSGVLAAPRYVLDSVLMTVAMAFFGFSFSWFAIGLGRPGLIASFEAVPKVVATLLSAVLLLIGVPIWAYPALLLLASVSGLLLFQRRHIGALLPWMRRADGTLRGSLRIMVVPALVDLSGASYAATPLPIVSATSSFLMTSMFASADKLYRYGLFGISALANALQAWVLDPARPAQHRRQVAAIIAHLVLGTIGMLVLAVGGPWATSLLFGEDVAAAGYVCFWFGMAYLMLSVSTPFMRNLLLPHGRASVILKATVAGAIIGVPIMIWGALTIGGVGVAMGLALSEFVILLGVVPPSLKHLGGSRAPDHG
ncbi:lipopolysaccharide biosynthesis protein [Compostimonas suwonensis]|uniref:PST family polysaccharide transporter n=1 Tax=Compostimonas suwonensis TaxID=1048394 RepID=A0A2M9C5C0_9MICO|nr:oligosaccharide flippase family protein [Compostimonas suwonensis]PJJ65725.1 PST family polysaccharide transporter [Compostimonas suwonensis]